VVASFIIWNVKWGGGGFKLLWHKLEMKVETLKKNLEHLGLGSSGKQFALKKGN
jgi:hypothetical protein